MVELKNGRSSTITPRKLQQNYDCQSYENHHDSSKRQFRLMIQTKNCEILRQQSSHAYTVRRGLNTYLSQTWLYWKLIRWKLCATVTCLEFCRLVDYKSLEQIKSSCIENTVAKISKPPWWTQTNSLEPYLTPSWAISAPLEPYPCMST